MIGWINTELFIGHKCVASIWNDITFFFDRSKYGLLLCSIIGIENNRLEQLALNKCHSIDFTFDYYRSSHQQFLKRFYSITFIPLATFLPSLKNL
jgi:hypothetical protein